MPKTVESETYELVKEFDKKYPGSLTWWRLKKHSQLVDRYLQKGEKVIFAIAGQWCDDDDHDGWLTTGVMALTTERIIISQNRFTPGHRVISIAPKFFNDVKVRAGAIWGTVTIDTAKEKVWFRKVSRKALFEVKNTISKYMLEYKIQVMRPKDADFVGDHTKEGYENK